MAHLADVMQGRAEVQGGDHVGAEKWGESGMRAQVFGQCAHIAPGPFEVVADVRTMRLRQATQGDRQSAQLAEQLAPVRGRRELQGFAVGPQSPGFARGDKMRLHPGQENSPRHGAGDEVDRPQLHRQVLLSGLGFSGDEDHRDRTRLRIGLEFATNIEPVKYVQQDERRRSLVHQAKPRCALARRENRIFPLQGSGDRSQGAR